MIPSPPPQDDTSRLRQAVLDWFVRRQRDDWRAQDEAAFQAWLAEDERHRQALAQWEGHWKAVDGISADALARLRHNLQRDKAQASAEEAEAVAPPPASLERAAPAELSRRRFLAPAFAMAGVVAVAGGTGLLAWNHWQAQPLWVQTFNTERGQQIEVPLPDGTRLRLDTATRLEVAYHRQRREVTLIEGQAVFSVQADAARPFHVLAGPVSVTVVGTRFSVRHTPDLPDAEGVRVAVEEGRVRVVPRQGAAGAALQGIADAVYLAAGEQVVASAAGRLGPVIAMHREGFAAWRDNRISFVDTPLVQALAELGRYGNTGLTVRDPAVAALRLSGTFDPRDAQTLRQMLPAALPVRLKEGAGITEVVLAR